MLGEDLHIVHRQELEKSRGWIIKCHRHVVAIHCLNGVDVRTQQSDPRSGFARLDHAVEAEYDVLGRRIQP
jgi:hypothetical protein